VIINSSLRELGLERDPVAGQDAGSRHLPLERIGWWLAARATIARGNADIRRLEAPGTQTGPASSTCP
jgi:hypothetical protein